MNIDIKSIQERANAATPGPWEQHRPNGEYVHNPETNFNVCMTRRSHDAEFIAHAREDIPAMIAEVERLEKHSENLRLDYIDLLSKFDAVAAERDAAVEDLREAASELTGIGTCVVCKFGPEETFDGPHCGKCTMGNCQFEWRGRRDGE